MGLYWVGLRDPSDWQAREQPILFVVMAAYGLGNFEKFRVAGLPSWGFTERYDIEARVPPHAESNLIPLMVQEMLAERFGFKAHWEPRQMPAAAIRIAPGGPKMERDVACEAPGRPLASNPFLTDSRGAAAGLQGLACGTWSTANVDGAKEYVFRGFTMQQLAAFYSGGFKGSLPIVDRTQLAGAFDFAIRVPINNATGLTVEERSALQAQVAQNMELAFRDQLGLNLGLSKPERLPVPVLLIDRIEAPVPN